MNKQFVKLLVIGLSFTIFGNTMSAAKKDVAQGQIKSEKSSQETLWTQICKYWNSFTVKGKEVKKPVAKAAVAQPSKITIAFNSVKDFCSKNKTSIFIGAGAVTAVAFGITAYILATRETEDSEEKEPMLPNA